MRNQWAVDSAQCVSLLRMLETSRDKARTADEITMGHLLYPGWRPFREVDTCLAGPEGEHCCEGKG